MKKIKDFLYLFFFLLFFGSISTSVSIRFFYPNLTETELFLKFWYLIITNLLTAFIFLYYSKNCLK